MDAMRVTGRARRPGGGHCRPAVLLALLAVAAGATADIGSREARRLREAGAIRPLGEVLAAVATRQPGRVLETELEREDGRYIYEIEVLDDAGHVHEFEVDAASAEILDATIERGND